MTDQEQAIEGNRVREGEGDETGSDWPWLSFNTYAEERPRASREEVWMAAREGMVPRVRFTDAEERAQKAEKRIESLRVDLASSHTAYNTMREERDWLRSTLDGTASAVVVDDPPFVSKRRVFVRQGYEEADAEVAS